MESKHQLLSLPIHDSRLDSGLLSILYIVRPNSHHPPSVDSINELCSNHYHQNEIIIVMNRLNPFQYVCANIIQASGVANVHVKFCDSNTIPIMINIGLSSAKGEYIAIQSSDTISHAFRFIHQLQPFDSCESITGGVNISLNMCKGDTTTITPSTMCMRRSVLLETGFMLDTPLCYDSFDACLWEYLWRYILINEHIDHDRVSRNYRRISTYQSLCTQSQSYVIKKILANEIPSVECMDLCVTYNTDKSRSKPFVGINSVNSNTDVETYTSLFSRDPEPILETNNNIRIQKRVSYHDKVMNIMNYGDIHERITIVFVATDKTLYRECLRQFKTSVRVLDRCSVLVCVTPSVPLEWVKHTTSLEYTADTIAYTEVDGVSHAFSTVFSKDYLTSPYTFFIQDIYLFKKERILHPLCYLIDILDCSCGLWNSIRFSSTYNNIESSMHKHTTHITTKLVYKHDPPIHRSTTFTDDPFLIRTRIASMFLQPYIDPLVRNSCGLSCQLDVKYKNDFIKEKLKMGVYERVDHPPCCENVKKKGKHS
jgi:hypothetical protein